METDLGSVAHPSLFSSSSFFSSRLLLFSYLLFEHRIMGTSKKKKTPKKTEKLTSLESRHGKKRRQKKDAIAVRRCR